MIFSMKHLEMLRCFYRSGSSIIAMIGVENQTGREQFMLLRVIGYNGAAYQEQVVNLRDNSEFIAYPVTTIVLNYSDSPWNQPTSLYEYFNIRQGDPMYGVVSDYKMHVVDVGFLPLSHRFSLRSDFRALTELLGRAYTGAAVTPVVFRDLKHSYALTEVFDALSSDPRVQRALHNLKEENIMPKGFFAELKEEAIREGHAEEREEIIQQLMKKSRL